jgi:hypothetical protein
VQVNPAKWRAEMVTGYIEGSPPNGTRYREPAVRSQINSLAGRSRLVALWFHRRKHAATAGIDIGDAGALVSRGRATYTLPGQTALSPARPTNTPGSTCTGHGWCFDLRSGRSVSLRRARTGATVPLRTFSVWISNGRVYLSK